MADLDFAPTEAFAQAAGISVPLPREQIVALAKAAVWWLYAEFKDQKIKRRVWFLKVTITVAHLRPLIEKWAGPEPAGGASLPPF